MKDAGYGHPAYAASLSHIGTPIELPEAGGWLMARAVSGARDAVGPYPLFACENWGGLLRDLERVADDLVSVSLVTDPFGAWEPELLERCFPDRAFPYKDHFVTDLRLPADQFVDRRHQTKADRAARSVNVEPAPDPRTYADEWIRLYGNLVERHRITGPADFGAASLTAQLNVPGLVMLRATVDSQAVGITLWYVSDGVASYHLGAYSEQGYELQASFAVFRFAIDHFAARGVRWLALGAGAGVVGSTDDGLARFKRGWSTGTRPVWFCGRVLDPARYRELCKAANVADDEMFFPAYLAPSLA